MVDVSDPDEDWKPFEKLLEDLPEPDPSASEKMLLDPNFFVFGAVQDFLQGLRVGDGLIRSMEREFTENDGGKWFAEYYYVTKHGAIAVPADKADPRYAEAERRFKKIGIMRTIKRRDEIFDGKFIDYFYSHDTARKAGLTEAEVVALRLYSGPPYEPINAALRARNIGPWATTISLCSSAVLKLSYVSEQTRVYRGVKEADNEIALPEDFLNAVPGKFAGGVELGFMSTTESAEVALKYSGKGPGSIFAIDFNMASRGAPISFLSQFPHEKGLLFPPMTMLETVRHSTRSGKRLVMVRASVSTARPRTSDIDKPDTDPQAVQAAKQLSQSAGPVLQPSRLSSHTPLGEYPNLPLDGYKAQRLFHQIDTSYPGVQVIHDSPFIIAVPNFLEQDECTRLIAAHATAQERGPSATSEKQSAIRTSTTVFPPPGEIDWLRERLAKLTNVPIEHFDPTKLTQYAKGEFFGPHVDTSDDSHGSHKYNKLQQAAVPYTMGLKEKAKEQFKAAFDGPTSVGSCPDRFCSVFIYLNDVDEGGRTTFSNLQTHKKMGSVSMLIDVLRGTSGPGYTPAASEKHSLSVTPRAGMAVIHFPCTTPEYGCVLDASTTHESEVAISPKYIVQQFIWARPLDQAKGAINAHSMEYVAFAEAGERETGKKGVVLVEAGRPRRYLTAEDLSAVPEQTNGALQKMIQKLDQKEFLDQILVVELDAGGAKFFHVQRKPSANGFMSATHKGPLLP